MRMFSFCTCIDIVTAFLLYFAIWEYLWISCLCSPFLLRYPWKAICWTNVVPPEAGFSFKMLHFAAFYVPSIYIPLCWHRSDQLTSGHVPNTQMAWCGNQKKKHHKTCDLTVCTDGTIPRHESPNTCPSLSL